MFPQTKQKAYVNKSSTFLNPTCLSKLVSQAAIKYDITKIDPEVLEYITLAAKVIHTTLYIIKGTMHAFVRKNDNRCKTPNPPPPHLPSIP